MNSFFTPQSMAALLAARQTRWLVCGLLILVSLIYLGLSVRLLIAPRPVLTAEGLAPLQSGTAARWSWFSAAAPSPQATPEPSEELALASINAQLLGVVIAGEHSLASISTSRNPEGVYRLGESIESGVTLEEVEAERVIISQRGSRRQIPLNRFDKGSKSDKAGLMEVEPTPIQPVASTGTAGPSGFSLSGLVSTTPVQAPGGGAGLRLGSLSSELTDLVDVQEGDVILALNGTSVGEILANPLLWQKFLGETSVPVTILRGDTEVEVFVNPQSLSQRILPKLGTNRIQ